MARYTWVHKAKHLGPAFWLWIITAGLLLLATSPVWSRGTVPAFQQDWSWPTARLFASDWVSSFIGQWSAKGLGQPNVLPLETYMVCVQYALLMLVGPSLALTLYLIGVGALAVGGIIAVLHEIGLRGWARFFIAGWLYALGPVMFTRVQAGHLAYILAYALTPWLFVFACRVLKGQRAAVVWLAILYALAASQVQFLVYGLIVVVAALMYAPSRQNFIRVPAALALGVALQLQGLLPLLTSAARAVYAEERPIIAWEQNLSAVPSSAAVMLDYFPHYYEQYACRAITLILWILLIGSAALAVRRRRVFALGVGLWLIGALICAGLDGPLAAQLQWLVTGTGAGSAFRDFQYAAVFTALGIAILVGCALELGMISIAPLSIIIALVVAPALDGFGLKALLLPLDYVNDMTAVARVIEAHGPGRVLWLPSEEPVGLRTGTAGLDIAIYGTDRNPSAEQERDLRILAFGVSSLRIGAPRLDVFRRLGIRFFVSRDYVRSQRSGSLGTGLPLAFQGINDDQLSRVLSKTQGVRRIGTTSHSQIFAIDRVLPIMRLSRSYTGALLQSQLDIDQTAVLSAGQRVLVLPTSIITADPRKAWVSDFVGRWFTPWISDSIYPYVWTIGAQPLALPTVDKSPCILVGSDNQKRSHRAQYHWRLLRKTAAVVPHGLTAVAMFARCGETLANYLEPRLSRESTLFVFASRYDKGWLMRSGWSLKPPTLADGWAMAWPASDQNVMLIYLPAVEQVCALIAGVIALSAGLFWVRLAQR